MNLNKNVILVFLPPERFNSAYRSKMEQAAPGREVIHTTDRQEILAVLDRVEIGVGFGPWDLFSKMPRLRWIQSWGAGVDGLVAHPELIELPVALTNTSGIHGEQLTEHIFALILAYRRIFPRVFASQKKREWLRVIDADVPVIAGTTMLILGYGVIGEQCARVALSFGMKVIAVKRRPGPAPDHIRVEPAEKIGALLGEADFVVNILPHTRETHGIIGEKEFAGMKKSAVYVNVGRGLTTDEPALIQALRSGQINAALLDVTSSEPLPEDSPLWDMENVIITPHYAGMRPDYPDLAMDITIKNMERYVKGEGLINLIDKNAGY